MKTKIFILTALFILWSVLAHAQQPYTAGHSGSLTGMTVATKIPASSLTLSAYGQILQAKAVFFSVEVGSVNFTLDGSIPTVAAGTNVGHNAAVGSWYFFDFLSTSGTIIFINAVDSSGATVKYTVFF